jgi:hypothetical protein
MIQNVMLRRPGESCLIQLNADNGHWYTAHPNWTVVLAKQLLETLPGAEVQRRHRGLDPTGIRVLHHPASGRCIDITRYPAPGWQPVKYHHTHRVPPSNTDIAFIGQYNHHPHCTLPPNRPGWYMLEWPNFVTAYREQVQAARASGDLDRRLYWSGTILRNDTVWFPPREAAIVLEDRWPDDVAIHDGRLPREEWFLRAAAHRLNLSLAGRGWCFRDVEMLGLGIPYLSVDYARYGMDAHGGMPVPNVHYVAVDHPCALKFTRTVSGHGALPWCAIPQDPVAYAEALHQRYTEVIDDTAFLDTIATNAMAWYDQHLAPAAVAEQIADEVFRIMEEAG